ncbi:MAG TPA: hypothetical protein VHZ29_15000 [Rhizomicrobium sp.]|jgi:hypothetical protein|nr:hypothetical protein [Rhizomicrobium sp.]
MTTYWLAILDFFASASALTAIVLTLTQMHGNRTHYAALHYLGQCDVALANPQFSSPELGKLDLRSKTFDGEAKQFERYEWYVARLVYVLDAAMRLAPHQQWRQVALTQLANHKHYFASEYYAKQDYLKHYSARMRKLIQQQRAA